MNREKSQPTRAGSLLLKRIGTPRWGIPISGASDLTRTGDLLITSEMHYRLCYTSMDLPSHYIDFERNCQQFFGKARNNVAWQ